MRLQGESAISVTSTEVVFKKWILASRYGSLTGALCAGYPTQTRMSQALMTLKGRSLMVTRTRELGGVQLPVLIGTAAALAVGGALLFFFVNPPSNANAQETGFKAKPSIAREAPDTPVAEAPRFVDDADKVKQGDLQKFRDESGNVRYRVREPFKGTSADGRDTYWRLEAFKGPPVQKYKMDKSKGVRKNAPKVRPPMYHIVDGKMVKQN